MNKNILSPTAPLQATFPSNAHHHPYWQTKTSPKTREILAHQQTPHQRTSNGTSLRYAKGTQKIDANYKKSESKADHRFDTLVALIQNKQPPVALVEQGSHEGGSQNRATENGLEGVTDLARFYTGPRTGSTAAEEL